MRQSILLLRRHLRIPSPEHEHLLQHVIVNKLCTYVFPVSSASKIGSHPKLPPPLGGTMLPLVRPSKRMGSAPGPALYAKVQRAEAPVVGKPMRSLFSPVLIRRRFVSDDLRKLKNTEPSCPRAFKKCLIYGPGSPSRALKQRAVSSVIHGPPT